MLVTRLLPRAPALIGSGFSVAPYVARPNAVLVIRTFRSAAVAHSAQDRDKVGEQFGSVPDIKEEWEKRLAGSDHRFPDWIEKWNADKFYRFGYGLTATTAVLSAYLMHPMPLMSIAVLGPSALYWYVGLRDLKQDRHAIRKNFPVIGNFRYLFESIRPEIRQYFVESDSEATPFNRESRSTVYARAKGAVDSLSFGTRRNVYEVGYEWANHSMWPKEVPIENQRITIGGPHCKQPYSAALLNISAMSYGALSDNAILALNSGARMGKFYHNTGEGGVSEFHLRPGGDIVWNIGTGYFGCRNPDGTFSEEKFVAQATHPHIKMIELKMSQGAKPAHGGILPGSKVTATIAAARGVEVGEDCVSPSVHGAFNGPVEMMQFIGKLRDLSGGKPVGFKLCIGRPDEFAGLVHAMLYTGVTPDFITVDGGEGGTGAAPAEFSNHIGTPIVEGLRIVDMMLIGAGIRQDIKVIASGKVLSGFSLVRLLALGADLCNAARAMMFSLGCIQALKCNTNTCPTGIATQDKRLMAGLNVDDKAARVARFQAKTVHNALEIIGAIGLTHPDQLDPAHIIKRVSTTEVMSYARQYGRIYPGSLVDPSKRPDSSRPKSIAQLRTEKMWESGKRFIKHDPMQPALHLSK